MKGRKADPFRKLKAKKTSSALPKREFFGEDAPTDNGAEIVAPKVVKRRKRRPNRLSAFASRLGRTQIFVHGKNGVRALGAAQSICAVSNVAVCEDGVMFEAPSKLLPKIVALLDNLCYDYKIIENKGLSPALFRAATRVGAMIGAAIFAVALAIYPNLVTRVSVVGEAPGSLDGALNARVQQILCSHGIERGKFVPHMDSDAISKELLALDGVAYAGVERHGTHVNVYIKRELGGETLWEINGSRVTATRLATVTRVIVEGGTAAVKYGDVVKEGDLLIDGYVLYGDDKVPVEAKGRVYGTTLIKSEIFFPDTALEKSYGEVKRKTKLGFFGKTPKAPSSPFECYELRTSRHKLGFLLPIECFDFEFRELKVTEAQEMRSDDELIFAVYSSLLAQIEEEAGIKATYHSVTRTDGGRTVKVTVEAEVLVSS